MENEGARKDRAEKAGKGLLSGGAIARGDHRLAGAGGAAGKSELPLLGLSGFVPYSDDDDFLLTHRWGRRGKELEIVVNTNVSFCRLCTVNNC